MFEKLKENHHIGVKSRGTLYNYNGKLDMLCIEINKEKLKWANGRDVPLYYSCHLEDNSLVVGAVPELIEFAIDFAESYADKLFSDEAIDYLYDNVNANASKFNMVPVQTMKWYGTSYAVCDIDNLNLSKMQESTVGFFNLNDSGYEIIPQPIYHETSNNEYFGTMIDGKIVSMTSCNIMSPEEQEYYANIAVSTNTDYLRKGYGVSNLVAIAKHNIQNGKTVTYFTGSNNVPSQKTATAAGFIEYGRVKRLFCNKNCL